MFRHWLYKAGSTLGPLRALRDRHRFLQKSQYWSQKRLANHQAMLLGDLLRHAASTVPFYRRYWQDRGGAVLDPAGLQEWPIVDKATLREHFDEMCSEDPHPDFWEYATGGSSGTPVKLLIDKEVKKWRWAAKMRNLEWMGWQPGDEVAFIWGSDFDRKRTSDLATRVFRKLSGQVWLNTFRASEAEYVDFGRFLLRWRPRFLVGYASSLATFVEICDHDRELRELRFEGVQSSAEVLHEHHKERLRQRFGCGVFDLYGQREVGNIAQNTVDDGPLLVNAESLIVETVGEGEGSRIVATDLRNLSFPLIRYDTGDLGARVGKPSNESRALPCLGPITGRQAEMLTAPNGRLVHCEYFAHLFYGQQAVQRFQLVVRGPKVVIRYQSRSSVDLAPVVAAIHKDIDPSWSIETERVDAFDSLASGKHSYVVREDQQ
ncbi:MAG: hypothetical protein KJO07_06445 [Deltaproteobacteria bacterium]|nr:hypothetical protein [Deltaproteobacteria bacterium]